MNKQIYKYLFYIILFLLTIGKLANASTKEEKIRPTKNNHKDYFSKVKNKDLLIQYLDIAAPNAAPIITEGETILVTMSEDGAPIPFSLTLNVTDTDSNGTNLTWNISSTASNGNTSATGTGSNKIIYYTPNADFFGDDSFTVQVTDETGEEDTIIVSVVVQRTKGIYDTNLLMYTENDSLVFADNDVYVANYNSHSLGTLSFEIDNGYTTNDILSFWSNPDSNIEGAISLDGTKLMRGTGISRNQIGTIDAINDGSNGKLDILFSAPLNNGDFEAPDLTGWNSFSQLYPLANDLLNLTLVPTYSGGGNTYEGMGTIRIPSPQANGTPTFIIETQTAITYKGTSSLRLFSSGRVPSGTSHPLDGCYSMHGPYLVSDPITAKTDDQIKLAWSAANGGDWYEVFGFLVNTGADEIYGTGDDVRTQLFAQRGDTQAWKEEQVTIPNPGVYVFEFVMGSYDRTGGTVLGASLYVDDISLILARADELTNAAELEQIIEQIRYYNNNESATVENKNIHIISTEENGDILTADIPIQITPIDDAPTIVNNTGLTLIEGGSETITIAMLSATDIDNIDEALIYTVTQSPNHGEFINIDAPTIAINQWTQQNLIDNKIQYKHDDSNNAIDNSIFKVGNGGVELENQTLDINISLVDDNPPILIQNDTVYAVVSAVEEIRANPNLNATDETLDNELITYTITQLPHDGSVRLNAINLTLGDTFKQENVNDGEVSYEHAGGPVVLDSIMFKIDDGINELTNQKLFFFVIGVNIDAPRLIRNNRLTLPEGTSAVLETALHLASEDDVEPDISLLYIIIRKPQYGTLTLNGTILNIGDQFTQVDLNNNLVSYNHDGSNTTNDNFMFDLSDGVNVFPQRTFGINITSIDDDAPTVTLNNVVYLTENSQINLTQNSHFATSDTEDDDNSIKYTITKNPDNGVLYNDNTALSIGDFITQQDVIDNKWKYQHNGSNTITDDVILSITDTNGNTLTNQKILFNISAIDDDTPIVSTNNILFVDQGSGGILNRTNNLESTDSDSDNNTLVYTITNLVSQGTIYNLNTEIGLNGTFTQEDINNNLIRYIHNNTETRNDAFTFSVKDLAGNTLSNQTFNITIIDINENAPTIVRNNIVIVNEGNSITITENADLSATDATSNDDLLIYTITSNFTHGILYRNNIALNVNNTFLQKDINNSLISYTHDDNEIVLNQIIDTLIFKVSDGTNELLSRKLRVQINPFNDAPVITSSLIEVAQENVPYEYIGTATDEENLTTISFNNIPSWLTVSNNKLIGTPLNGASDTTFTIIADDGAGKTDIKTVILSVTSINDSPIINSTASTIATEDILYTYTTNVTDIDDDNNGTDLTYTLNNEPTGMLISNTGVITWTPREGIISSGPVTLTVSDGGENGASPAIEIFTIAVTLVNDAPSITSMAGTTAIEDVLYTYSTVVVDPDDANDGIDITYLLSNQPTGMLISTTGVITWTPLEGIISSGTVTLTVSDGGEDTAVSANEYFIIAVTPVNDAPIALEDSYNLNEGELLTIDEANGILTNDTDEDRDELGNQIGQLECVLVSGPNHGLLTLNLANGSFTYQHDGSNETIDSFTYKASDGQNFSNTVTVSLNITEINDIPIANQDTYNLDEASSLVLDLLTNDTDGDNEALSIEIIIQPTDGIITDIGSTVTYVHGGNNDDFDTFTYRIKDTRGVWSEHAMVNLNITLLNDAPIAINDGIFNILENSGANILTVLENDTDEENSDATGLQVSRSSIRIASQPTHGSASIEIFTGRVIYTPTSNYVGDDSFTYNVKDISGSVSNDATVSIYIAEIDDFPNTTDDIVNIGTADISTPVSIDVLANDDNNLENDINISSLSIVQTASNGTASVVGAQIQYTPNNNSVTSDFLQYTISDNAGHISIATNVYINLVNPLSQPLLMDDVFSDDETNGTITYTYDVLNNDSENGTTFDLNTLSIINPPSHGNATINAGKIEYTPTNQYIGEDNFTYKISTDNGIVANGSNGTGAKVSINLNNIPSAAVATNDNVADVITGATAYINILSNDTDPDTNNILSENNIVLVSTVGGSALIVNGIIEFTSDGTQAIPIITYKLIDNNDGSLISNTATVTISTIANHPPVVYNQYLLMQEDTSLEIDLHAFDIEGDVLSWSVSLKPNFETVNGIDNVEVTHGSISGTAPNITYTPEANYFIVLNNDESTGSHIGHDHSNHVRLIFTATDSEGNISEEGLIEIGVMGVQDPPIISLSAYNDVLNNIIESNNASTLNIKVYEDELIDLSSVIHNENVDIYDFLTWTLHNAPTNGVANVTGYSQGIWDDSKDKQIVRPSIFTYTPYENFNGTDSFIAQVYDPYQNEDQITINVEVIAVNDAPIFTSTATTAATEDVLYTYTSIVNDVDNNDIDLIYSLTNAPLGMSVNSTGVITWTPLEGVLTSGNVTLTVSDGDKDTAENFTITVTPVNDSPVITSTAVTTATEDVLYTYTSAVNDVDDINDGTGLTYGLTNAPLGMSVNSTGLITWTPLEGVLTSGNVTLTVLDGSEDASLGATENFTITVTPVNDAPSITSIAGTIATEDVLYTYTSNVNDVDDVNFNGGLTYILTNAPLGMSVNSTGVITWTPLEGILTSGNVTLTVSDGGEDSVVNATEDFTITVTPVNDAPVITSTAITAATEDILYTYTPVVNDVDNSDVDLTYYLTNAPTDMNINSAGVITWTPLEGVLTSGNVTLTVSDGDKNTTENFSINVSPVNDPPIITSTAITTAIEDVLYTYTSIVYDIDNDSTDLTYKLTNAPLGMSVSSTGVITWTPLEGVLTSGPVTLIVSDDSEFIISNETENFTVTVTPVNDAPVITSTAITTATEDVLYTYTSIVNDVDDINEGTNLTYELTNAPLGMSINSTGVITWTPLEGVLTSGDVTLKVSDGGEDAAVSTTENFTITVTPINDAPVITSTAITTATEDVLYTYTSIVDDVDDINDGTNLSYELTNAPLGMSVNSTGVITWTPLESVLTSGDVTLTVSDGGEDAAVSATENFTITVTPVNDAPIANDKRINALDNLEINIDILDEDIDPDGDIMTVSITINPIYGNAIVNNDGSISYKADLGAYCKTDEITYQICDPEGLCDQATIIIEIGVLDSDDDSIPDAIETITAQTDSDSVPDYLDLDSDNDGISDEDEAQISDPCNDLPVDSDGDGIPNYMDTDSDNDGYTDKEEGNDDCDNDGIPNYLDPYDDCSKYIDVPEGFSPNGDGVNDFFTIKGIRDFPNSVLIIFNRWGTKIYRKKGYQNNWGGRADNKLTVGSKILPEGTYYYVIDLHNGSKALKGFIYINY